VAAFRAIASGQAKIRGIGRVHYSSLRTAFVALLFVILVLAVFPLTGSGTEEYAEQTGKECSACHVDPSGGGELTTGGEAYLRERVASGDSVLVPSRLRHTIRFIAGFLHLFTAVLWFGTILYVHLLLKPSYAAHGLPRGELIVGWGSIILIALTGVVLTVLRIRSVGDLFHTRFGILLTVKIVLYLVMVSTAVIVTFIVGPRLKKRGGTVDRGKKDMTADELALYDGKEGRPAYFALDGRIHDATGSSLWREGSHVGRHLAGFDLSDALKQAPHGKEKIESMPVVSSLLGDGAARRAPLHLKGFYFMAYFNLVLVVAILFIIAMWRWW
jgi:predicted heme/steroid binding protein